MSIDFGECKQDGSKVGGGMCLKDTCFGVDGIGVSGAGWRRVNDVSGLSDIWTL